MALNGVLGQEIMKKPPAIILRDSSLKYRVSILKYFGEKTEEYQKTRRNSNLRVRRVLKNHMVPCQKYGSPIIAKAVI